MNFEKLNKVDASLCALPPSDGDSIPASSGTCAQDSEFASAGDLPPIFQQQPRWINALHRPFTASSEDFLKFAQLADSDNDALVRRHAEFFDGCHWLALGNIDEAAQRFQRVRSEIPEADKILKKLEADRLKQKNLSALEVWELYNREAEAMQKDVDHGYLARFFSNEKSLEQAREKRFVPELKLIQELKRRIEAGEAETLEAGLKQIQQSGPEEMKELSGFLLSKDAKTYVGDPRPALIDFASSSNPEKSQVEFLLQRSAELERQSDMPSTCYAVNALVRAFSEQARGATDRDLERLSSGGQFAATLAKLALSASAEGVAGDVALMFASAGLGNLAKLSMLVKLEKAGITGYQALALAGAAGIGVESTAFWAGNTAKDAALHDPEEVLKREKLAKRYGATLLMIAGLKGFGKLGESFAPRAAQGMGMIGAESGELSLGGKALVQGIGHGAGLGGLTATNQLNQALGWQERPEGGFSESFAGDVFSYVEFAMAHKMADQATGKTLSEIQQRQRRAIAAQEKKLVNAQAAARSRPLFLHPIFAPLWAFMGTGIGGGGGSSKPKAALTLLEKIKPDLEQIPNNPEWRHKIEREGEIAAGSHHGIGYDAHNEDRYFFAKRPDGKTLLVAIDGLGGHVGGEQASAIVRSAFEAGVQENQSVAEILGLAHRTVAAYSEENYPPSPANPNGRFNPGAVAAAVEIQALENGEFTGRFWNIGDAEALVLRISPQDGSVQVVHHTARPTIDAFERKRDGEPFRQTQDGRIDLEDIFDHRLLDSPVESFLGDKAPVVHYQRKALKAGDIVLVGSDGFFENFKSFDLIGKIIAQSGAKTSAQIHEALFQESLIRMALLEIANDKELNHQIYSQAYRRATVKAPPRGWKGMYEPLIGPDGKRKSYRVFYRGILDNATGQVVDSLKQDNLTLLVQVLGEEPKEKHRVKDNALLPKESAALAAGLGVFLKSGLAEAGISNLSEISADPSFFDNPGVWVGIVALAGMAVYGARQRFQKAKEDMHNGRLIGILTPSPEELALKGKHAKVEISKNGYFVKDPVQSAELAKQKFHRALELLWLGAVRGSYPELHIGQSIRLLDEALENAADTKDPKLKRFLRGIRKQLLAEYFPTRDLSTGVHIYAPKESLETVSEVLREARMTGMLLSQTSPYPELETKLEVAAQISKQNQQTGKLLEASETIGGLTFPRGTWIQCDEKGRPRSAIVPQGGWSSGQGRFAGGTRVEFHENGKLKEARLSYGRPHVNFIADLDIKREVRKAVERIFHKSYFAKAEMPDGATLKFDSQGRLREIQFNLAGGSAFSPCGWTLDSGVKFFFDERGSLEGKQQVGGRPLLKKEYFSADRIGFFKIPLSPKMEKPKIQWAILSKDEKIQGIQFAKGARVEFDREGNLLTISETSEATHLEDAIRREDSSEEQSSEVSDPYSDQAWSPLDKDKSKK